MKLCFTLTQLFLLNFCYGYAQANNDLLSRPNELYPINLLPNLPDLVNLFKQFEDLMKNGLCGIDLENLLTHDPDEKRSTVKK